MASSDSLKRALAWSGALRRKVDAQPQFGQWLEQACTTAVDRELLEQWYAGLADAHGFPDAEQRMRVALRRLRLQAFSTIMVRDIAGMASLQEVVATMTQLAELALQRTYVWAMETLCAAHGVPRDPKSGLPQEMMIIGMGKLGGCELNVSSDIDLVMLYDADGETAGPRPLSHHEFYGKLTRAVVHALSDNDAWGRVFRTDLRLRPDGDIGPLAWSLDAFENYLIKQGREWERYAWLKSRIIPCSAWPESRSRGQIERFHRMRDPFVYRKYLDFDALAALRDLRERIREDWNRRALARRGVAATHNIKLGDGGIREIEFIVQLTQLMRGGRMPSLQEEGLLPALGRQQDAGVLSAQIASGLAESYVFLRRTEHMLQYREDEQTHMLPHDPETRAALAAAMGMEPGAYEASLARHREFVSQTFHDVFRITGLDGTPKTARTVQEPPRTPETPRAGDSDADPVSRRIHALMEGYRVQGLPRNSRARLQTLLPRAIEAAQASTDPAQTALRLLDLLEQIAQRSAYLALLAEYPQTLDRVARIVGASPWAAQYLARHPLLLDSLIEWGSLLKAPDIGAIAGQLRRDLDACTLPDGRPDIEQQMNLMRDVQHQVTFQLLAQDLEGLLTVESLADELSHLADVLLEETIVRTWPLIQPREPAGAPLGQPRFAVIAYGKLGGKELGYASDLDLVFVYDDPRDDAVEIYAKLGRRMSSWLSTLTSSGRLYEIDLRLRPDGDVGLLAVSLHAFRKYQMRHAWSWEHQAITRARYAAGDPQVGTRFEEIRRAVLLRPRDPQRLREEIRAMRRKISAGHPNRSPDFDLKHDRGGMVDVEFITQFLVLSEAARHPVLLGNLGNIALLRLAAEAGLIPPALAQAAGDAYRDFRRMQHALRLQGAQKARVAPEAFVVQRETVVELWNTVIGN